jgi:heme/copper-type cytochrome/quinol oxidase subunit 2
MGGVVTMSGTSRTTLILTILTIAGVVASSVVLVGGLHASQNATSTLPAVSLPPGCVRPAGGFLIIMSEYGYNDSVLEGAGPTKAWPVITVAQGQTVNITVCNVDKTQSHGFQISNYFDSAIEAVGPDRVLHVPTFVATKAGTFQIYCAIFCTIHLFMEYGQLRVTS